MTVSCSSPEKRLSWLGAYFSGRDRSTCDGLGWADDWRTGRRARASCTGTHVVALWPERRGAAEVIMIGFDCRLWLFTLHVRFVLPSTVRLNYGMAGLIKESTYVIVVSCTLLMLTLWFTSQPGVPCTYLDAHITCQNCFPRYILCLYSNVALWCWIRKCDLENTGFILLCPMCPNFFVF
jgi:hypothetical protein